MNTKKKKQGNNRKLAGVAFLKFISFIFPLFLYLLMVLWLFPAPNSGFIALGVLGCFILGLGLVNVAGLVDDMYIGHFVTAICGTIGFVLITASSIVMYTSAIYSQLDETYISFYFIVCAMLLVCLIYYFFFRHAVALDLQGQGKSKTFIKKAMKGKKNYWWYQSLRKDMRYPWVYGTNKLFTILYPAVCVVHLLLGWWKAVVIVDTVFTCVLLILSLLMYGLVFLTWKYGYVDKRRKSPLIILGGFVLPIAGFIGLINYLLLIL